MNEEGKLIEDQWKTLPPKLQGAITSVPWKSTVQEIGVEYNLNPDQTISLEQEVMFVLYGFENPVGLSERIMREVGVEQQVADQLSDSVWEKIMGPIDKQVSSGTLNTTPDTHPATIPGETVHEVPRVEQPVSAPQPAVNLEPQTPRPSGPQYTGGQDPYREPLQ